MMLGMMSLNVMLGIPSLHNSSSKEETFILQTLDRGKAILEVDLGVSTLLATS